MKKTSEDSLEKLFFPKFKLLNSGCGLSAGVYGIFGQFCEYFKEVTSTVLLKKLAIFSSLSLVFHCNLDQFKPFLFISC